jgi:aminoglycoside N3'-acetyltransferase
MLAGAGIVAGDAVFVHSDTGAFDGFTGSLTDIIQAFQDAVTSSGNVLMPTFSMRGSAIDVALSGKIYDPAVTPSQTGMLTEVFRRSPGVLRSIHPTHSVAVWGRDARWWIEDHHRAGTPCGRGTPFFRLLEHGGKIAFLGVGFSVLTFYHCVEELLERRFPQSPFTIERYALKYKIDGRVLETPPMRLYSPDVSRRRRLEPLERQLRRTGKWHEQRRGALRLIVVNAADILESVEELARRGTYCYDTNEDFGSAQDR